MQLPRQLILLLGRILLRFFTNFPRKFPPPGYSSYLCMTSKILSQIFLVIFINSNLSPKKSGSGWQIIFYG